MKLSEPTLDIVNDDDNCDNDNNDINKTITDGGVAPRCSFAGPT